MAAKIVTFRSDASGHNSTHKNLKRRVAHRLLDAILDSDAPVSEHHFLDKGPFAAALAGQFHDSMHRSLLKKRSLREYSGREGREGYNGPQFTVAIDQVSGDDHGFILRPRDIPSLDRGRFLMSAQRGGRAIAYQVTRFNKDEAVLAFYFKARYQDPNDREDCTDDIFRQLIRFVHSHEMFVCPLCGESTAELYLPGMRDDSYLHFGCVACCTALDEKAATNYEAAVAAAQEGGAE